MGSGGSKTHVVDNSAMLRAMNQQHMKMMEAMQAQAVAQEQARLHQAEQSEERHRKMMESMIAAQRAQQEANAAQLNALIKQMLEMNAPPPPKKVELEAKESVRRKWGMDTDKYNWCITGASGVGKSTMINTLRNLKPKDEGAAPTGLTETTQVRKAYDLPQYEFAQIWDLPGGGTALHPSETYFVDERIDCFDAVIIVTGNRLTEFDIHLFTECGKHGVPAFIVRNKFAADLRNYCEDDLDKEVAEATELEIRELQDTLRDAILKQIGREHRDKVYVLCSKLKNLHRFDMDRFLCDVLGATRRERFGEAAGMPEGAPPAGDEHK